MSRIGMFAVLAAVLALAGCDGVNSDVTATSADGAKTINGAVNVPAGSHTGGIGTVNGSVSVGENAVVGSVHAVNGPIELAAHALAQSVAGVNGGVTVGREAHVAEGITTVNGGISLEEGAEVSGMVRNVNGPISLTRAHVAGGLRTVSGDIEIAGESHVEGGIVVQRAGWFNTDSRKPRIVIGPGAVVSGELRFERPVELFVSEGASVGPITGATAVRFAGDKPAA